MKTLYPLDTTLVKLAYTTLRQQLMARGLDSLEQTLPDPMSTPIHYAREAPVYFSEQFQNLLGNLRDAEPTQDVEPPKEKPVEEENLDKKESDELEKASSEMEKEQNETKSDDADVSEEFVKAMKDIASKVTPDKKTQSTYANKLPSALHGTTTDFYLEDDMPAMGPTFTLQPPYIQI